ncbi:MAG: hypothetical protein DLM62_21250 [Pseudonocardiales bacterium]|nr:MAG: hypothetical protein DLM62_21250 [Pseudonocardiales bacterium]
MLVIVILWALTAVIFLTGTLAAANRIESRVGQINASLTPINSNLNTLPVLNQVSGTANQIRDAAANLSPTIGRIADSASTIDSSLKQVNDAVGPINKSAKQINASVSNINNSVRTINSGLANVVGQTRTINGSVHSINDELTGTLNQALLARSQAELINDNVTDVIRSAQAIKGDTGSISAVLGTAGIPRTINGNAFGIETSPLLLRSANSGVLREMAAASARQDPTSAQAVLPTLDLLPQISALGLPELPALPTGPMSSMLTSLLQQLPVLGDTGDLLSGVVAPK